MSCPSPGTPSMRTWPPATAAMSTCSIASRWPTIDLCQFVPQAVEMVLKPRQMGFDKVGGAHGGCSLDSSARFSKYLTERSEGQG